VELKDAAHRRENGILGGFQVRDRVAVDLRVEIEVLDGHDYRLW
jgi:hypothetical protein